MVKVLALVLALAGCEASLGGGGGGGGSSTVDGGGGGGNVDGAVTQVDAAPACANNRRVYLHFTGNITLADAATSDALNDQASWLTNASAAIPPWRQNVADRLTQITEVVDGVKARLATTPIEVLTTRPTSGPYVMIVLGGANTNNGGTVGTIYSYATSLHDCGDSVRNDLGWVSDMNTPSLQPTSYVADIVVGAIGWGLGLDGTTDPADCMCGWANGCSSGAGACTLSANIATSITNGAESACTAGTQNEVAAFTTEFCKP